MRGREEESITEESKIAGLKRGAVMLATPLPFAGAVLDYLVPHDTPDGAVVIVPLGQRQVAGVFIGVRGAAEQGDSPDSIDSADSVDSGRLRVCEEVCDTPPIPAIQRDWLARMARWTMANPGAVLKMMLPSKRIITPPVQKVGWRAATPPHDGLPPKQHHVLEAVFGAEAMPMADLRRLTGVSASTIRSMARKGLLEEAPLPTATVTPPQPDHPGIRLNPEQARAAATITEALAARHYAPFVLDGVTGSGKTEVYFEAVAGALRAGRKALILLPEIALSPAMVGRFTARFAAPPLLWHSGLAEGQRQQTWHAARQAGPLVVVGARSALFLPFTDLGLIVIDEEHDGGYKQDEQVIYHARDMAVMRAHMEKAVVVMVSATPSLETEVNIDQGRYQRLCLSARVRQARLPEISLVDLGKTPPERGTWLAPPLVEAMEGRLAAHQQVLLFLNRRGYAPITLCRACGVRITCPHCSAWLVLHRHGGRMPPMPIMRCHHCGHECPPPDACPSCEAEASLVPCGPGVERLSEEVARRFPEARQAVLSSDLAGGHKMLTRLMGDVASGAVDILIGTQMVAKGHDFPKLTLVGVVDADLGLGGGDLRAAERTWQMLVQVAGRAGRTTEPGLAMLQTAAPDTDVLQRLLVGDREGFLANEKAARRMAGMPPYGRLAAIILSAPSFDMVAEAAGRLGRCAPHYDGVVILGPAPAPMALLRGRHRMRFLLRCERRVNLQAILRGWLEAIKLPSSVRLQVDIDPYHFI